MQNLEDKPHGYEWHLNGERAWIALVLAILVGTSGYCLCRLSTESQERTELLRTNQALQSSLDQANIDLRAAADKLIAAENSNLVAQATQPVAQSEAVPESAMDSPMSVKPVHKLNKASGRHPAAAAHQADDPRWGQMDAKLKEQEKQLESAKSDIAKTREDLEGNLSSTRNELTGAIAKTHDEVVELRKRGERNYYEFNLNKSSEFERNGPVSLSLRKANVKHKYYDIALVVDDQRMEKKHVNLYEPLWISVPDRPGPVQVVVNSITKDNVKGYLSEPRFKKSELARNDSPRPSTIDSNSPNPSASQDGVASADKTFSRSLQ